MGLQHFLSTDIGTDSKFVQAIDELIGSLPENVASRISNFNKDSVEVENSHLQQDKSLYSKENESPQCKYYNGPITTLDMSRRPSEVEENLKEDSHAIANDCKANQEHNTMMESEQIPINNSIDETYYLLADVIPPHQSRDFSFKPINNDDYYARKKVDIHSHVEVNQLQLNLNLQGATNKDGDVLIEDPIIELDGDFRNIQSILYHSEQNENLFDKPDIEMSSRIAKFANGPFEHAGDGDCFVVPLKMSNQNQEISEKLADLKRNTFKVSPEDLAQSFPLNFPSMHEKPIKIQWALTRIACYKDASTYEVMRPFKKAPKKLPGETDKVFIVINDKGK